MNKKVLIISGSPRKSGNSDLLCDEFMRGAAEAGNEVEKIRVAEKKIGFCSACYYCRQSGGVCAKKDDIKELAVGADVRSDDALSIRGRNVEGSKSDVVEWIDQLNY